MLYTEVATLLPRCCFMCQNASGPFVDLRRDDEDPREAGAAGVQFGGVYHLYVCVTCAMSMAQIVEKASPNMILSRAVVEQEARAMAAEHAEVEELREENVLLKNAIGTIRSFDVGTAPIKPPKSAPADRISQARRPPRPAVTPK